MSNSINNINSGSPIRQNQGSDKASKKKKVSKALSRSWGGISSTGVEATVKTRQRSIPLNRSISSEMPLSAESVSLNDTESPSLHQKITKSASSILPSEKLEDKQNYALSKLFNLHILDLPTEELKHVYASNQSEKVLLMKQNLDPNLASKISSQARRYPIMRDAVAMVKLNLEKWDNLALVNNTDKLSQLRESVANQFHNINQLSMMLSELEPEINDHFILSDGSVDTFQTQREAIIKGEDRLDDPILKEEVKARLKSHIDVAKTEISAEITPQELRELRSRARVTNDAIQLQSQLQQAIRDSKIKVAETSFNFKTQGGSLNEVYNLGSAFFKVGRGNEMASGTMEKLIWDIAVLMGLENQFVPTGETTLKPVSQTQDYQGGIQVAQTGTTLPYCTNSNMISKEEVIDATLATLAFGMWDAHAGNIFISSDGKIKFFDNTRSLPNSNGFINWGNNSYRSSYCNGLLDLPVTKKNLTASETDAIKNKIATYKMKMKDVKEFLASKQTQAQLKKLPDGWLNIKSSIAAMEERLNLMEKAVSNQQIKSIQDLVSRSIPTYNLTLALTYLDRLDRKMDTTKLLHASINHCIPDQFLERFFMSGYNIQEIEALSMDPKLKIDGLLLRVKKLYANRERDDRPENYYINRPTVSDMIHDIKDLAKVDNKDMNKKESTERYNRAINATADSFFKTRSSLSSYKRINFRHKNLYIKENRYGRINEIITQHPITGLRITNFEFSPNEGMIIVNGDEVNAADFLDNFDMHDTTIPTINELPVINSKTTRSDVVRINRFNACFYCVIVGDQKNLVIGYKGNDGQYYEKSFIPDENNRFIDSDINIYSLEDLASKPYLDQLKKSTVPIPSTSRISTPVKIPNFTYIRTYYELPELTANQTEKFMVDNHLNFFIRKSSDRKSLVVALREGDKIKQHRLKPNSDWTFQLGDRNYTIAELIKRLQR